MKRIFDIILSSLINNSFFPLGLIIILILRFSGEGEIFYKQMRIGKEGQQFGIYKFATMVKDSPKIGAGDITLKYDPRILPFGKFLRKTKLNEFPQFLNVLMGELSLVGPRPLVKNQYNMIPESLKLKINKLQPGITGIGSIVFRDEEKYLNDNDLNSNEFYRKEIIPFKATLESWYAENYSIILDLIIIIFTIIIIIFPNTSLFNRILSDIPKHPIFNPD